MLTRDQFDAAPCHSERVEQTSLVGGAQPARACPERACCFSGDEGKLSGDLFYKTFFHEEK
jgi:hypothetical protein